MSVDRTPFWKKRRFYLPLLIAPVVNLVVYFGLTYRLHNKQEILTRDQTTLTERVSALRAELAQLKTEGERISGNEKIATSFWNGLPLRDPGLIEALAEIDRLAREVAVSRGRTTYAEEDLENGAVRVKATIPVEGSYFDLVSFVNRLERSPRFFLLESIKLNGGRDGGELALGCSLTFCLRKGGAPAGGT